MIQVLRAPERPKSFGESLLEGMGGAIPGAVNQYFSQKKENQQAEAENRLAQQLGLPNMAGASPELRKALMAEQLKQGASQKKYAQERGEKLREQQVKDQQEDKALRELEYQRGLEPGSMNAFKGNLSLGERTTRPAKPEKKTQANQPIDPEQLAIIDRVRAEPGYDDLDEDQKYRKLTSAGVSRENSQTEAEITSKLLTRQGDQVEKAYNAQKSFIDDTTNSYRAFEEQTKPKLLQMQHMPAEDIIGPTANVFLEEMGIPLGALEDPSSELYNKLSLDLLKGLPETYGNRILKVEVDNFLKTIPSLMNSADGRRMIASNMLKLGEMKGVYYNEMRKQQMDYLDKNKPLPRDFEQRIFDQVKPQVDRINDEFVKMSEITSVPEGTVPFFDPSGEIKFVPATQAQWASENGGRRIW